MTIALAFVVGMLVVAFLWLAWWVRAQHRSHLEIRTTLASQAENHSTLWHRWETHGKAQADLKADVDKLKLAWKMRNGGIGAPGSLGD